MTRTHAVTKAAYNITEDLLHNRTCLMWSETSTKSHGVVVHMDFVSIAQLVINIAGVIGNTMIIALLRKHSLGGRLPTIFFRSQAVCDLLVNLESIFFGIDGAVWSVTASWVNHLICRLWHSQFLFWLSVQLSIGNLVLIGLERFLALSFPMTYQQLQPTRVAVYCVSGNLFYNLILASPNILETGVEDGCCLSQHHVASTVRLLRAYSIVWFIMIYVLAFVLLVIFYGGVIVALRESALLHRVSTRSATMMRFTRMAIVITVVYVACISYDAFAYLTSRTGLWTYQYNTIWHNLGMLFVSLNSFANPYIYYLFVLKDSCHRKFKLHGFKLRQTSNILPVSQQSHPSNYLQSKRESSVSRS
ncbi:hypothetical protein FGIG_09137 [Fasciola gigantica]|uniref:G-protein coupled receptors family 1 profile domain-containing protein n=1 Tax=Fasciola gigantica TaxID=46835 RepID=A0A504YF05_FASGI|nr:hypothetical protein FGIG_09137 [Fasciola gigantica]